MCNPGISITKTDEQIASDLRRHMSAMNSCFYELGRRKISVTFRAASGYSIANPEAVYIRKEVSL